MKIKNNIIILGAAALLTACMDEFTPIFTVGEEDNAIVLGAGIGEGGAGVQTRSAGFTNVETKNHSKHLAFTSATKTALRIDGKWYHQNGTIEDVIKPTTATIGNETSSGSKHNSLSMLPQLYWDDYGTADPSNMGTNQGRDQGLTIYGAAVNGVTTAPVIDGTAGKQWNALIWTLDADQKTNDWKNKDLLISNNIQTSGPDGTYRFDDRASGKLLEYTHAMSKITVRLIAGEGFPTTGVGQTTNKFAAAPDVKLSGNEGDAFTNPWANTLSTINITDGTYSDSKTPAVITMKQGTVTESQKNQYTVIYEALVAPGSLFADKSGSPEKYPLIAQIKADGNIYYITSEKIRTRMHELNASTDYKTESGKNYIITATINKTKIEVTATITDWTDVEAASVTPTINVSGQVGDKGATDGSLAAFDFYMRETSETNYTYRAKAGGTPDGDTKYQFKDASDNNISLYWPTHDTHYHMRGVAPTNTTVAENKIAVSNAAYNSTTSPSNLMIGAPEIAEAAKMCNNSDHTSVDMIENGICARNNTINLNFRYMMSQVEVKLKSTGTVGKDLVTIDNNTKVEIVGGYEKARILLGTREHDDYTNTDKPANGIYNMHARDLTSEETSDAIIKRAMHDIIVPQVLSDDMMFKVTVKNSDDTYDIYYAQLNKIEGKKKGSSDALAKITEWKPGEHYIYELDILKTEIQVTATLTDWTTVTADQPIWF